MTGQGFQDYKALRGRRRHSYNRNSTSEATDSCIFREHWNGFHEAILGSRIVTRDSSFVQSTWPWGIYDPLFPNVSQPSIFQHELDGNLWISTYQMIMNHVQDRDEFEDNTTRLTFLLQVPAILRRWRVEPVLDKSSQVMRRSPWDSKESQRTVKENKYLNQHELGRDGSRDQEHLIEDH